MLLFVVSLIVLALVGLFALAASRPDSLLVQRSIAIQAAPARIYPLIEDFRRWTVWSPYEGRDPGMKRDYSGPAAGPGAVYAWDSAKAVGSGRMEIIEAQPSKVVIKLDFLRPMKACNTAVFTLEPMGDTTRVTWSMEGRRPFIGKLMGLVFDMDKLIGGDFDTGLASLKAQVEA